MLDRWRELAWKLSVVVGATVAIAAIAEVWHAAWNSCAPLTNFGRPSVLACFHPGGGFSGIPEFWMPDFFVLLGGSLSILVAVFLLWEFLVWRFKERIASVPRQGSGKRRWRIGVAERVGLAVPALAFGASLLAFFLVSLGTRANLADPWQGILLVILLTIPSVGAVFALLAATRLSVIGSGSPVIAASGAFVGSLFGYLPFGLFFLTPFLAPLFAYAAYLLSYVGDPTSSLSRGGAAFHLAVSSAAYVPLAVLAVLTLLFLPLIAIYVVLVAAILATPRFRGRRQELIQGAH
ncbi:MAG: hypothetical protein ACE5LS_04880 [Thermoplasmata archaeon]